MEENHRGMIYAGFTWELIKQIKKDHGEEEALRRAKGLILGAAKMDPSGIPQAVRYSLYLDYEGGSPNRAYLEAAAQSRNIPLPLHYDDLSSVYRR
jgi:hypothetical protein